MNTYMMHRQDGSASLLYVCTSKAASGELEVTASNESTYSSANDVQAC